MPVSIGGSGFITGLDQGIAGVGIITAATFSGDLTGNVNSSGVSTVSQLNVGTGGSTGFDSNGRLGIGTNNTSNYFNGAENLVVADYGGDSGITIASTSGSIGRIHFADGFTGNQTYAGWIAYLHDTDSLVLAAGGVGSSNGSVRIDSTGNVNITNGNLVLASGNGIDFSANSNAAGMTSELLDDYEEGTFTPTIVNGFTSPTYTNQQGIYTKIGNIVRIHLRLDMSGGTALAAQAIRIGNLPFVCENTNNQYVTCTYYLNYGSGTLGNLLKPLVIPGQSYIQLYQQNNTNVTQVNGTDIGNTLDILLQAVYQV